MKYFARLFVFFLILPISLIVSSCATKDTSSQSLGDNIFSGQTFTNEADLIKWEFLDDGTVVRYGSDILSFNANDDKKEVYKYSFNEEKEELYLTLQSLVTDKTYTKSSQYIKACKNQLNQYVDALMKNAEATKKSKKEFKSAYTEYFSSYIQDYFSNKKTYIYKIRNNGLALYRYINFDMETGNLAGFVEDTTLNTTYEIDIADGFISFLRLDSSEEKEVLFQGPIKYDASKKKLYALLYRMESTQDGNFIAGKRLGNIEASVAASDELYELDGYTMQKCSITFTKMLDEIPLPSAAIVFTSQFWIPITQKEY